MKRGDLSPRGKSARSSGHLVDAMQCQDAVNTAKAFADALPSIGVILTKLDEGFRRAVLDFLVGNGAVSEVLRRRMLAWRHGGFSAHNEVSVAAEDTEGRKTLAGYVLHVPMSLRKMTYDAATGTVSYRSKMHAGLKRNFQVMSGAAWLELLCRHIPDRYVQLAADRSPSCRHGLTCAREKTPRGSGGARPGLLRSGGWNRLLSN